MRKSTRKPSMNYTKYCNICGEEVLIYTVSDNAILCNDCVPVPKSMRKIINEASMINKLLLNAVKNIDETKQIELNHDD